METTIYKVRAFVNRYVTRGRNKGSFERTSERDWIVINNLASAKSIYEETKKVVEYQCQLAGYTGKVELFIPHIFEDGTLAYWPDEDYIERWSNHD